MGAGSDPGSVVVRRLPQAHDERAAHQAEAGDRRGHPGRPSSPSPTAAALATMASHMMKRAFASVRRGILAPGSRWARNGANRGTRSSRFRHRLPRFGPHHDDDDIWESHLQDAEECHNAKLELLGADDAETFERALKKVDILCH
jgi:hypothetical protein